MIIFFCIGFAGSSNGRTRAFEVRYPGPNPGPAATRLYLDKYTKINMQIYTD